MDSRAHAPIKQLFVKGPHSAFVPAINVLLAKSSDDHPFKSGLLGNTSLDVAGLDESSYSPESVHLYCKPDQYQQADDLGNAQPLGC